MMLKSLTADIAFCKVKGKKELSNSNAGIELASIQHYVWIYLCHKEHR